MTLFFRLFFLFFNFSFPLKKNWHYFFLSFFLFVKFSFPLKKKKKSRKMSSCHKKKKNKKQKRSLRFPTQQRRPTAVAVDCALVIRRSYLHDGTTGSPICLPRPPTPTQAPPSFFKKKKKCLLLFFPLDECFEKKQKASISNLQSRFLFLICIR